MFPKRWVYSVSARILLYGEVEDKFRCDLAFLALVVVLLLSLFILILFSRISKAANQPKNHYQGWNQNLPTEWSFKIVFISPWAWIWVFIRLLSALHLLSFSWVLFIFHNKRCLFHSWLLICLMPSNYYFSLLFTTIFTLHRHSKVFYQCLTFSRSTSC